MNKTFIKLTSFILIIAMLIPGVVGCKKETPIIDIQDIVILFTSNNRGAISDNIGYDGLAAYKYEAKNRTNNVTVVDLGNIFADSGNDEETVLKTVDAINRVGYDFGVMGENEFALGLDSISDMLAENEANFLGCNISYKGKEKNLLRDIKPYSIVSYGAVDVAYIGVSSPDAAQRSDAVSFTENEKEVYDFINDKEKFYSNVQKYINECDELGAEYIVILSSLDKKSASSAFNASELAQKTSGADVILDRSAEEGVTEMENKEAETVLVCNSGEKLSSFGELIIGANGTVKASIISN